MRQSRYRITALEPSDKLDAFIEVPWTVFKDDAHWSPPLRFERREIVSAKANPYFAHAKARYFLATRDGVPVGRVSAQICELVQQRMGQGTGQFGFFDCIDDAALAQDLLAAAEGWLQENGMRRVLGPFSLSINEEVGMLIDGFETPPCMLMGHARPYYRDFMEAAGYRKAIDMYAYWLDITSDMPPNIQKLIDWGLAHPRLHIRDVAMKRFDEEIRVVLDIFNDAWRDNWGYIPLTEAEIAKTAKDLRPLIKPYNTRIIEYDGVPAAFMVALPDLNRMVRDLDGRLLPFGWAKLAYRLLRDRHEVRRVPLMGVRKALQKGRLGGVMAMMLIDTIRQKTVARGGRYGELSWILEDNRPMRSLLEAFGCQIYKTYRVFEKAL
ncbi:MAG: N-acetyltransferase [Pseudomonadota bacterium]